MKRRDVAAHPLKARCVQKGRNEALKIIAVQTTRHIGVSRPAAFRLPAFNLANPILEVAGLIRECAHTIGANIQEMAWMLRAVSNAGAKFAAFKQDDLLDLRPQQKLDGGQNTTGSTADHHERSQNSLQVANPIRLSRPG